MQSNRVVKRTGALPLALGTISFAVCFEAWGLIPHLLPVSAIPFIILGNRLGSELRRRVRGLKARHPESGRGSSVARRNSQKHRVEIWIVISDVHVPGPISGLEFATLVQGFFSTRPVAPDVWFHRGRTDRRFRLPAERDRISNSVGAGRPHDHARRRSVSRRP